LTASKSANTSLIRLENELLEVSVFSGTGAKVFDLIDQRTGHNFLWHNPRIGPQAYPIEANFDNYWCGGWDDGFPTCEACTHNGEQYPNLGEFRSVDWKVEALDQSNAQPSVTLSAFGPISPIQAEKRIRLRDRSVEVELKIDHLGFAPLDFIWGTHPAYSVEPGCRIHIPARTGIVGQANHPSLGEPGQRYEWPVIQTKEGPTNVIVLQPRGKYAAGHYATDLSAGWYAVEYPERRIGLLFQFPLELCPYLWLWLSYGGWRGYYVAVVEPWTSCPVTLSDAVAAGTHRVLLPGEHFACKVRVTPWSEPETNLQKLLEENGLSG
jgi:galactose mutarotase-like enzyme